MINGCFAQVATLLFFYVGQTHADFVVDPSNTGATPGPLVYQIDSENSIKLGENNGFATVKSQIQGENIEINVCPKSGSCQVQEAHLCNVPSQTMIGMDSFNWTVPIEDVYDFVCAYDMDYYQIQGHVTIECDEDPENLSGVDGAPQRRLIEVGTVSPKFVFNGMFEIIIGCGCPSTTVDSSGFAGTSTSSSSSSSSSTIAPTTVASATTVATPP